MQISIPIPDETVAEVKANVLAAKPIPLDDENQPLYTDMEWLDELLLRYLKTLNRRGSDKIAITNSPPVDF